MQIGPLTPARARRAAARSAEPENGREHIMNLDDPQLLATGFSLNRP
jgi:hypothetical protein